MDIVLLAAAFAGAVAFLFVLVRAVTRALFGRGRRLERELALRLLQERRRRGEITQAEHDAAAAALGRE
jgi:uncharacterized membrane protein